MTSEFCGRYGSDRRSRAAGAERDAAHARAVHLHRYRMLGIGDQDDLGRDRACARDLAEDAGRVDRGLAPEDAVARALVDEHALTERIEVHAHDLGDQRALHDAGRTPRTARRRWFSCSSDSKRRSLRRSTRLSEASLTFSASMRVLVANDSRIEDQACSGACTAHWIG